MIKKLKDRKRIIAFLSAVIVIMIGVGLLMNLRLNSLLKGYVEQQVTEQARTLAMLSAEQFELEIHELENLAAKIPANIEKNDTLLDIVINDSENITMGLLCLDGTALKGSTLNFTDFSGIQDAFHGNSSICYKEGQGILFTTPVYDEENVIKMMESGFNGELKNSAFHATREKDKRRFSTKRAGLLYPSPIRQS